ncbi:hypothetical protein N7532_008811 [Penicillium argentinense]|uniref:Uncharacterized protein n=1 Tax=Penicillium argentinense TaxID=1131581 RepID=A0A9W9EY52_9EURO|nr:uncharacterized protein N7532_008811 [Penicillium argentinense]KAJ5090127.1 hypothetical protein N7532_008811 [Penicillium argentinense]
MFARNARHQASLRACIQRLADDEVDIDEVNAPEAIAVARNQVCYTVSKRTDRSREGIYGGLGAPGA